MLAIVMAAAADFPWHDMSAVFRQQTQPGTKKELETHRPTLAGLQHSDARPAHYFQRRWLRRVSILEPCSGSALALTVASRAKTQRIDTRSATNVEIRTINVLLGLDLRSGSIALSIIWIMVAS